MKKNVSGQFVTAQLVSKTDGSDVTTGTTTVSVTGDGGARATGSVGSGAATHKGDGLWEYAPAQAETNFDHVSFQFANTSAVTSAVHYDPNFPQTGDAFARLGAPAGATVSADIADLPTNAELATALGTADDAVLAQVALVKAKTDNLPSDPADASDIAGAFSTVNSSLGTIAGYIDTEIGALTTAVADLPTNAELATALGTTDDAVLAAIAGLSFPTATEIADGYLRRQFDDVDDTGGTRDMLAVGRMIRNGFNPIVGTDLEVLKEDDTTVAWTRTLTTDPLAEPIVGVGGP